MISFNLIQGYVCSQSDGDTNYCSMWKSNSVCYTGKCYTPSDCTRNISTPVAEQDSPSCKDTGYVCHGNSDGSTEYCHQWASDSVCYSGHCYSPQNCRVGSNPASSGLTELREAKALLEDLLRSLETEGEDEDTVPEKFDRLIKELSADEIESDFGSDISIKDMVNVYRALGYKDTKAVSDRTMIAYFDDEINIGGGKQGKAVVKGVMYSDSFSINACFDQNNKISQLIKFIVSNKWNEEKRMSTSYIDGDNGAFCLQSDAQLTKYAKANIQIAKEQAAYFVVSIQAYHQLILATYAANNAMDL